MRTRRGSVVLLELHGVLRVELSLLLQPAVILLLVLRVLGRLHWRLGRTLAVLRGSPTIASPGVTSRSLRANRTSGQVGVLRSQFCLILKELSI